MPYKPMTEDPEAAVRDYRERLYWITLASGMVNVIVLAMHLAGASSALLGPLFGTMCGSLIVAGIKGQTDSHYNALVGVGLRWMAFALGILLLLLWIQSETSIIDRLFSGFAALQDDALLLALILSLTFHAGYAFAYLRDTLPSGGDNDGL